MTDTAIRRELEWIDERLVKSMARVHYLCLIDKGFAHGYDIIQHVKEKFRLKCSASMVYPVLQSLESDGFIRGEWIDGKEGHPSKKRYYLTPSGKKLITTARKRIPALVNAAFSKSY